MIGVPLTVITTGEATGLAICGVFVGAGVFVCGTGVLVTVGIPVAVRVALGAIVTGAGVTGAAEPVNR